MKYMGSKARIAKEILPIILKDRKEEQWYVEPFAGGMNTISEVLGNRIANDNNKYLIEMWKGLLLNTERPSKIDKEFYDKVRCEYKNKSNKIYSDFLIGWVGFMASANGRFFDGGYSGLTITKDNNIRDYISESIKNIEKQIPKLKGVNFYNFNYLDLKIPKNSIIYCDKPYFGVKQYSTSKNFNHNEFWLWCKKMKNEGHSIFISEYEAPKEFICIWEKVVNSSLSANGLIGGNKKSVEKLFIL